MSRIITFSRQYPSYHPRKGEPTYFVEKIHYNIWNQCPDKWPDAQSMIFDMNRHLPRGVVYDFIESLETEMSFAEIEKGHTIRAGHRFKAGDWFKPVVWGNDINPKSGRSGPYHSKQIRFAPEIQVKKTWDLDIHGTDWYLDGRHEYTTGWSISKETIAGNDGLSFVDFCDWFTLSPDFKKKQEFFGQIICWNENIDYK